MDDKVIDVLAERLYNAIDTAVKPEEKWPDNCANPMPWSSLPEGDSMETIWCKDQFRRMAVTLTDAHRPTAVVSRETIRQAIWKQDYVEIGLTEAWDIAGIIHALQLHDPQTVSTEEVKAQRDAFLAGAKWWESHSTNGTMWQSDQKEVWAKACERYPGEPTAPTDLSFLPPVPSPVVVPSEREK